ncbi:hypothetical protein DLE01_00325 [Streptomyces sp. FT05W]|nr:hypothetical protein DLE01_00325 [Streptomyces sp. FT05W]
MQNPDNTVGVREVVLHFRDPLLAIPGLAGLRMESRAQLLDFDNEFISRLVLVFQRQFGESLRFGLAESGHYAFLLRFLKGYGGGVRAICTTE